MASAALPAPRPGRAALGFARFTDGETEAKPQRSPSLPPSPESIQPTRVLPGSRLGLPVCARRALGWCCGWTSPRARSMWADGRADTRPTHQPAARPAGLRPGQGWRACGSGSWLGRALAPLPATPSYSPTLRGRWGCPMPGLSTPLPPSNSVATRSWGSEPHSRGMRARPARGPLDKGQHDAALGGAQTPLSVPPLGPCRPSRAGRGRCVQAAGQVPFVGAEKGTGKKEPCARDSGLRAHWDRSGAAVVVTLGVLLASPPQRPARPHRERPTQTSTPLGPG